MLSTQIFVFNTILQLKKLELLEESAHSRIGEENMQCLLSI